MADFCGPRDEKSCQELAQLDSSFAAGQDEILSQQDSLPLKRENGYRDQGCFVATSCEDFLLAWQPVVSRSAMWGHFTETLPYLPGGQGRN
ncbi:hypothetical protein PoB_002363100 [Plakobranchus ocellatus]|uniref:Uncharacterized protein n=1 Tax=Plakobranchus ocellatus TaxID=259542 RepID=A0AAV3ZMD2_9GAST|nr:hypothetical protein PoB_002363100 [Plakobranchus ocellatus]